jgi:hypothetical protein
MPSNYQADLIGPDGQIIERLGLPLCRDDRSAVDTAKTLPGKHTTIVLWDGGRKVGRFERTALKPSKRD